MPIPAICSNGKCLMILVNLFKLRIFCDSVSLVRVADRKQLYDLRLRADRNHQNCFFRKAELIPSFVKN